MTTHTSRQKTFEDIVKQSDLLNQIVLDSTTLEELGRIEVLWMYPQINRVLGFVCKSGLLGNKKAAFKLPQLSSIGENGVLITGEGEPTVAAKVNQLESLIHSEVWSDAGHKVGHIIDCLFNYRSGVIVRYLLVPGRFGSITDGVYFLPPKAIKSFGRDRVLIYNEAAQNLKPYRKGWKYKLAQARASFKEDYIDEVTGELRSLTQRVQLFSQEAMTKVEHWGDRLRDETQTFIDQARERGQAFYERARTSGQAIFDQIRAEGLSFNDHMRDTATRTDSEFSQPVTFPQEDADTDSTTADYDDDDWEDDWNDWEAEQDDEFSPEEQDWSVSQGGDRPHPSPESTPPVNTQPEEEWDDWDDDDWDDDWDGSDEDERASSSQSQQHAPPQSAAKAHPIDIWDEGWVDDVQVMPHSSHLDQPDDSTQTISVKATEVPPSPSPDVKGDGEAESDNASAQTTTNKDDDDDPWI